MKTQVMELRTNCAGLLLAALAACGEPPLEPTSGFGVNLAGPEFGAREPGFSNITPGRFGKDFVFPRNDTLAYYSSRGLRIIRLPLSWERLQPTLGAALDATYSGRVLEHLDAAAMQGCSVVLDLHNYGRYRMGTQNLVQVFVLDAPQSRNQGLRSEHLADLWLRLGIMVREHPALLAYGLMNEPHDMGRADWHATSNRVVKALRAVGDCTWIWVAGDGWSKAHEWNQHNPGDPWVHDPLGKTAYEAHLYFDADGSGRYHASFAEERRADAGLLQRGSKRLEVFSSWCRRGGVTGVIGEFGVPWFDEGWIQVLEGFLASVQQERMTAIAWAGGDWWGDYALSLQPRGDREVGPLRAILRAAGTRSAAFSSRAGGPAARLAGSNSALGF